jgi:CheY-like chemotaxis protein
MRCATVSVIDRGQGIPREELGKLFQPFQRLSVRPTAGETSTGLGLAITRNIIWAHAGDVQVESEQGRGSTFRMLLPLPTLNTLVEQGKALQQQQPQEQGRRSSTTGFTRRPPAKVSFNVLVADDNAINLRLLTLILKRQGHAVWTAKDGQEALDLFLELGAHEHFHILLIDEEMPHMCGAELIGHIRQHEAELGLPRIPLVSASGHADSEHKRAILEAGADDVCPKPFSAAGLLDVVERLAARYYLDRLAALPMMDHGEGRA